MSLPRLPILDLGGIDLPWSPPEGVTVLWMPDLVTLDAANRSALSFRSALRSGLQVPSDLLEELIGHGTIAKLQHDLPTAPVEGAVKAVVRAEPTLGYAMLVRAATAGEFNPWFVDCSHVARLYGDEIAGMFPEWVQRHDISPGGETLRQQAGAVSSSPAQVEAA